MSTHILDVSGQRPLNLTINDPARTAASCSAKAGDDVAALVGACRETSLVIPPGSRIQKRRYVTKKPRRDPETNALVRVDGEVVYDEFPYEELVLVVSGSSVNVFGRASQDPRIDGSEPTYEPTPHTTLTVRRMTDLFFTESGELVEEHDVRELVPVEPSAD